MTRVEKYAALREKGCSYKEIADIFGCSYQNVQQILAKQNIALFQMVTSDRVVFDGLRKWMNDNKVSINELYRRMNGKNAYGQSVPAFRNKLNGRHYFRMDEIDRIMSVTGLSYENLFSRRTQEGEA